MRRGIGVAALCFAALITAGCGTTLAKSELADEISKQMAAQLDRKPKSVTCPSDLKGEVGQTTDCTFEEDGETLSVKVTVTKVEGSAVLFDINPEPPKKIGTDELADAVSSQIEKDAGFTPESVDCPDEVDRKKDEMTRCAYTSDGIAYPVNVTITDVDGADFTVGVDEIPTVPAEAVAQNIVDNLTQQFGLPPGSTATCPGPLDGVVGTEMRCELFDTADTYGVTVTVNEVQGTNVNFGIKVDDQPR